MGECYGSMLVMTVHLRLGMYRGVACQSRGMIVVEAFDQTSSGALYINHSLFSLPAATSPLALSFPLSPGHVLCPPQSLLISGFLTTISTSTFSVLYYMRRSSLKICCYIAFSFVFNLSPLKSLIRCLLPCKTSL